jgi:integrase
MTKRKKQARTRHPGITLSPPKDDGRASWRATWIDPDTRKRKWATLDASAARNQETRQRWAMRAYRELRNRRLDLETGSPRMQGVAISEAVARFYRDHPKLRAGTVRTYRTGTDRFEAWAERSKLRSTDDLTRGRLMTFRAEVAREPKQAAKFGGDRGEYIATKEERSPYSINRELAAVRRVLRYTLDCDQLPRASKDDLGRAFKLLPTPRDRVAYLKPKELQRLLEAAQRYDADNPNRMRPVPTIAPFVAFVLLTGMRLGEAVALDWRHVDLEALDASGKEVGEIEITSASKTKRGRTVGLEVSPALRKLLVAQKFRTGGRKGAVWGITYGGARKAAERLVSDYGAPKGFTWQALRKTCATFLVNAGGIFGAAGVFMESRQLGHSVKVAEDHYFGVLRGIPHDARTLEAAMQIETQVRDIIASARQARKVGAA